MSRSSSLTNVLFYNIILDATEDFDLVGLLFRRLVSQALTDFRSCRLWDPLRARTFTVNRRAVGREFIIV